MKKVDLPGLDANGGPCYIGSGCFHRRKALCGMKYSEECEREWKRETDRTARESASVLEASCKVLASCSYEENTQWGKEVPLSVSSMPSFYFFLFLSSSKKLHAYVDLQMGLKYGCSVEDIITGLSIQCRGWKSISFSPERKGFVGVAPTTLLQSLIQHKRWSEGNFQIFLSRYCPLLYGHKRIPLELQFSYCPYLLWAPNCLPTLYYVAVPSLCLLGGFSLFPEV